MKYLIILVSLIISFLLVIHKGAFLPPRDHGDKIVKIAREIHGIASCCQILSSEEMKAKRLQFLNDNKDVTIEDLVKAIEAKIDGQDIIALLDSFNCDVCKEYADSVKTDYDKGIRAIKNNFGSTSIEMVMYWRLL